MRSRQLYRPTPIQNKRNLKNHITTRITLESGFVTVIITFTGANLSLTGQVDNERICNHVNTILNEPEFTYAQAF